MRPSRRWVTWKRPGTQLGNKTNARQFTHGHAVSFLNDITLLYHDYLTLSASALIIISACKVIYILFTFILMAVIPSMASPTSDLNTTLGIPVAPSPTTSAYSMCTLGALQIGVLVSYLLFGVTTTQTYIYYGRFPDDSRGLKFLVGR